MCVTVWLVRVVTISAGSGGAGGSMHPLELGLHLLRINLILIFCLYYSFVFNSLSEMTEKKENA